MAKATPKPEQETSRTEAREAAIRARQAAGLTRKQAEECQASQEAWDQEQSATR